MIVVECRKPPNPGWCFNAVMKFECSNRHKKNAAFETKKLLLLIHANNMQKTPKTQGKPWTMDFLTPSEGTSLTSSSQPSRLQDFGTIR